MRRRGSSLEERGGIRRAPIWGGAWPGVPEVAPHLIEENCSTFGDLEKSVFRALRAGEYAALMSEQLPFHESRNQSAAVNRHIRTGMAGPL